MKTRTLYATLIGINDYPNPRSKLKGCIKDVLGIDLLLRDLKVQQGLDDDKKPLLEYEPLYLLAPNTIDKLAIGDYETAQKVQVPYQEQPPTFANVSGMAFDHLKQAKDGDICLLYYSGHGSYIQAPEVFWHSKPSRQNETIVCVDSRSGARDLIDKELAYLLWDALRDPLSGKEKNVHCVVIMDCCFAGNNTRGEDEADSPVLYRHDPPSSANIPLEQYLGFYQAGTFYQVKDGKANIKIARYVHLGAALDTEKSQETSFDGGLFTSKLLESLRAGGGGRSYRDLVDGLAISVRNRAGEQNPVAFSRDDKDLDQQFLGAKIIPYKAGFEVRYDAVQGQWILYGGAMQGIVASTASAKTLVQVDGVKQDVEVLEVFSNFSVLDPEAMHAFDPDKEQYKAVLLRLANPGIQIGLSEDLFHNSARKAALISAYTEFPPLFFEINFDQNPDNIQYVIQLTSDDQYALTRLNGYASLFKREKDPLVFLRNADSVGKWINTSELKNANSGFSKNDFVFTLEKIEGKPEHTALNSSNLDNQDIMYGEKIEGLAEETVFQYLNGKQPAFRLSIAIHPDSKIESCYVGALYLNSKFGIGNDFIRKDANLLRRGKDPLYLQFVDKSTHNFYKTIPLTIDKGYKNLQINEITEFLKIFVSNQQVDLQRFVQDDLQLDSSLIGKRSVGLESLEDQTDWTVFTTKIRLIGPNKTKALEAGTTVAFPGFSVSVPNGIKARAFAATADDQQRKLKKAGMKGLDAESDALSMVIMPPAGIWGEELTSDDIFAGGLSSSANNGFQVLEITTENASETLVIPEGETMLLSPITAPGATRSMESDLEETIIPYGYDEASELFFPLGYSDEAGNVHIQVLPAPSYGIIQGDGALTRSVGGSIKLYFKKLFRKKRPESINTLQLYQIPKTGDWKDLGKDPSKMGAALSTKPGGRAVLLVHGHVGDTRHIVAAFKEIAGLSEAVDFVLTYDYECLSTEVSKTAEQLNTVLSKAGFGQAGMPELVIVAHSMGGLVSRFLLEVQDGKRYVKKLIQVGVPNAGSELAQVATSVFGMLTHAMNVTGPVKLAISGLSFLLKKLALDPGQTLKDLRPGSAPLQQLALSRPPEGIPYHAIAGNTALLKKGYHGNNFFLKKVARALKENLLYPGISIGVFKGKDNDMAVTLDSMQGISGFDAATQLQEVASDHLAYFRERRCQVELLGLISPAGV